MTVDSHVKVGRPGDRRLSVRQPGTSRNEDKVGGDLCQEVKPYVTNDL